MGNKQHSSATITFESKKLTWFSYAEPHKGYEYSEVIAPNKATDGLYTMICRGSPFAENGEIQNPQNALPTTTSMTQKGALNQAEQRGRQANEFFVNGKKVGFNEYNMTVINLQYKTNSGLPDEISALQNAIGKVGGDFAKQEGKKLAAIIGDNTITKTEYSDLKKIADETRAKLGQNDKDIVPRF